MSGFLPLSQMFIHLRRMLSHERLGFFDRLPSEKKTAELLDEFAKTLQLSASYLDNVLWLFCAKNYGNICGEQPKCSNCDLSLYCNYPRVKHHADYHRTEDKSLKPTGAGLTSVGIVAGVAVSVFAPAVAAGGVVGLGVYKALKWLSN